MPPLRYNILAGIIAGAGGAPYVYQNAQAAAWAARLSSPISNQTAPLYDTLFTQIGDIIANDMDAFYLMATERRDVALLNLVGNIYNLVEDDPNSNINFVQFRGYSTINQITAPVSPTILRTGIILGTPSLKFQRDDSSMGLCSTSFLGTRGATMGAWFSNTPVAGEGFTNIGLGTSASEGGGSRLSTTATRTSPYFGRIAHAVISRVASANYQKYTNSNFIETFNSASAPVELSAQREVWIMSRGLNEASPQSNHAYAFVGRNIDATKVSRIYYAMNEFLAAVGAEPRVLGGMTSSMTVV